eukprot:scaffold133291_cov31-Tisochrysis_lutea.AAC.3
MLQTARASLAMQFTWPASLMLNIGLGCSKIVLHIQEMLNGMDVCGRLAACFRELPLHQLIDLGNNEHSDRLAICNTPHPEGSLCKIAPDHVLAQGEGCTRIQSMLDVHASSVDLRESSHEARCLSGRTEKTSRRDNESVEHPKHPNTKSCASQRKEGVRPWRSVTKSE